MYPILQGNWSGSASSCFKIPSDVFRYLQHNDADTRINNLTNESDLLKLVENVRYEIANGSSPHVDEHVIRIAINELKICGHLCTTSSVKDGCCRCADSRPHREEGTYPMYIDGEGWADKASRGAGYCPVCRY